MNSSAEDITPGWKRPPDFYFWSEDAADWIDRTVRVEKISALTLDQWAGEYLRLKKLNRELMATAKRPARASAGWKPTRP